MPPLVHRAQSVPRGLQQGVNKQKRHHHRYNSRDDPLLSYNVGNARSMQNTIGYSCTGMCLTPLLYAQQRRPCGGFGSSRPVQQPNRVFAIHRMFTLGGKSHFSEPDENNLQSTRKYRVCRTPILRQYRTFRDRRLSIYFDYSRAYSAYSASKAATTQHSYVYH